MNSSKRSIGIWLLTGCFLIFAMVIVGGITRLTGSGLSITEWQPIMGAIPPMNEAEWQEAFDKYKQIPQFQKVNYDFTLNDFKSIFFWEYLHRQLGRFIGIVFIVPFIWFYFRKKFDAVTLKKVLFLFMLGALQGLIGWLMVKSGLTDRTSVSHTRLAIHLVTAFITFGFTFYFALELLFPRKESLPGKSYRLLIKFLLAAVTVQIIYGAFVAGMHAGKVYNTFPLMNDRVIPEGVMSMTPAIKNFTDNHATVQFIHRMLAFLITGIAVALFVKSRRENDRAFTTSVKVMLSAVAVQFLLGVFTLLSGVDITLALLHQAGAFLLFSACIYLIFLSRSTASAN